ncbi:kinetochore Sim4 complex subunit FTA2-domain-containing protein [Nemania sp. FL0031]|nr:kinetochore Sim4 complex subunit FTA2-domain-containing protein [Nemania sp. FL0031]
MAGLPDAPGPKLYPFDTSGEPLEIDFLEELGRGIHGIVWKVKMKGNIYALKIFPLDDRPWVPSYSVDLSSEDKDNYFLPFMNECRAYGRLKEFGREDLAFACHGYVILTKTHVDTLRKLYSDDRWCDWGLDPNTEYGLGEKLHALVKEFIHIPEDDPDKGYIAKVINPRIAHKAIRDLKTLHHLGISSSDIHGNNFLLGKHVEFSCAWTAPHPCLTRRFGDDYKPVQRYLKDTRELDKLIDRWNEECPNDPIWVRCEPNEDYRLKLRTREDETVDTWGVNPVDFSYEKAQKRFGKIKGVVPPETEPWRKAERIWAFEETNLVADAST